MGELRQAAGMAYRETGEADAPVVLLVHGYPESSFMWTTAMDALAAAGWRAIAPDLPGYGRSAVEGGEGAGTWERHVESLESFRQALGLDGVVLVTHDWGVMIGLRWACDHPGAARALAISDGGFFADRRWHDMANTMRTEGEGERLIEAFTEDGFRAMMGQLSDGMTEAAIDEYWLAFSDAERRRGHLALYRSGDFDKLAPYEGCVAGLGLPALVLWGANDRFAGVKMAKRFHDEIADSELVVLDDAGHFSWEDAPDATAAALVDFLARRVPS